MTEMLINATALLALLMGLAALVHLARKDVFAGPGTGYTPGDELGPLAFRRRPL